MRNKLFFIVEATLTLLAVITFFSTNGFLPIGVIGALLILLPMIVQLDFQLAKILRTIGIILLVISAITNIFLWLLIIVIMIHKKITITIF